MMPEPPPRPRRRRDPLAGEPLGLVQKILRGGLFLLALFCLVMGTVVTLIPASYPGAETDARSWGGALVMMLLGGIGVAVFVATWTKRRGNDRQPPPPH